MRGEEREDTGASAEPTGLSSPTEPASSLGPTGFDPSRVAEVYANEQMILAALDDAYQAGRMEYLHFSPAWDVTATRMAALSWHLPSGEGGEQ